MTVEAVLEQIKLLLIQKKMEQRDLAERLNKSQGWVSKLMSGEIRITLETLLQIAEVLDIEPASLIPSSRPPKISFEDYVRSIIRDEVGGSGG